MKPKRLHILLALLAVGLLILAGLKVARRGPSQPKPAGPIVTATCTKCGHETRISQAMLRGFFKSDKLPEEATIPCEKCGAPAKLAAPADE